MPGKIALGVLAALTSLLAVAALALSGALAWAAYDAAACKPPDLCLFSSRDLVLLVVVFLAVGLVVGGIALLLWLALRRRLRADYLKTRAPRAQRRRYERERR